MLASYLADIEQLLDLGVARVVLGTLAALLVLALIVIRGPLRRATRVRPGTALRYQ